MTQTRKIKVVYLGSVTGVGDKRAYEVQLVKDGKTVGETSVFAGTTGKMVCVGNVYNAKGNTKNDQVVRIAEFSWHDHDQDHRDVLSKEELAALQARDSSTHAHFAAFAQAKKNKGSDDVLELLKPIRRQWKKTNAVGRMALEVRVLNYLRHGVDL